jgi:hypothetical protein
MTMKGQYSSIQNILVHFTQDDLHCLASDSIDISNIIESSAFDVLVPNPLVALRRTTIDLIAIACPRTTNFSRITTLSDQNTYSWKDKNGDVLCIHTPAKLDKCLALVIDSQTTKFILVTHCDLLYFAYDFDGLDLNKANTTPFPTPKTAPLVSGAATTTPTSVSPPSSILATTPPMDIFNYKALPLQVQHRFKDHQDPNKVLHIQDMTKFLLD